jgi:hypothetical protein
MRTNEAGADRPRPPAADPTPLAGHQPGPRTPGICLRGCIRARVLCPSRHRTQLACVREAKEATRMIRVALAAWGPA